MVERSSLEYTADECAALPDASAGVDSWWYVAGEQLERVPLSLRPSSSDGGTFAVDALESVGKRIALTSAGDLTALGSAIHNCIALAFSDRDKGISVDEAKEILERWDVGLMADPAAVMGQAEVVPSFRRSRSA